MWTAWIDLTCHSDSLQTEGPRFAHVLGDCTFLVDAEAPKPEWTYVGSEVRCETHEFSAPPLQWRLHFKTRDVKHALAFVVGGVCAACD